MRMEKGTRRRLKVWQTERRPDLHGPRKLHSSSASSEDSLQIGSICYEHDWWLRVIATSDETRLLHLRPEDRLFVRRSIWRFVPCIVRKFLCCALSSKRSRATTAKTRLSDCRLGGRQHALASRHARELVESHLECLSIAADSSFCAHSLMLNRDYLAARASVVQKRCI